MFIPNDLIQKEEQIENNNLVNTTTLNTNQNYQMPTSSYNNSYDNEELLKAFIGKNYDKITKNLFNISGFFFTTFYLFYRKMFLYGILLFLINLIISNLLGNYITTTVLNVLVGLLVNKVYLYYANKKIEKIKTKNSEKSINELKEICAKKGGTSIGKIFLGFLTEIVITLTIVIVMLIAGIGGILVDIIGEILDTSNISENIEFDMEKAIVLENVTITGHTCYGSDCTLTIKYLEQQKKYYYNTENYDLLNALQEYSDYLILNIYYNETENEKIIGDYKLYLKSNNEDITNIKTAEELENKIGVKRY